MTLNSNKKIIWATIALFFLLTCSLTSFANKDASQSHILSILRTYLQSDLSKLEKEKKESFIKNSGDGYCSGISTAWLYHKWLQFKKAGPNDMYGPITRTESEFWFQTAINLILEWEEKTTDEKNKLDMESIAIIDSFIYKIEFFQKIPYYSEDKNQQGELDKILTDTNKGKLRKEYTIASLLTLEQLKQLLKIDNFIQEGKLIYISSHNHATALFKKGGNYYYFNPNTINGEIIITSTDDVARYIFEANFPYPAYILGSFIKSYFYREETKPFPLAFCIFSFDEESLPYPSQEKILNKLNPSLVLTENYADNCSGLIMAVRFNSLESMQYFLKKGADPNEADIAGHTALMVAALEDNPECIRALITHPNIDPNIATKDGTTALMVAALEDNPECIRALITHPNIDPNIATKNGKTALMFAALEDNPECIRALITHPNIDPNIATKDGTTALMFAALEGNPEHIRALITHPNIDPNIATKNGKTALMFAALEDNPECIRALITHPNIDPNIATKDGMTALTFAALNNNPECIRALITHPNIDPNMKVFYSRQLEL